MQLVALLEFYMQGDNSSSVISTAFDDLFFMVGFLACLLKLDMVCASWVSKMNLNIFVLIEVSFTIWSISNIKNPGLHLTHPDKWWCGRMLHAHDQREYGQIEVVHLCELELGFREGELQVAESLAQLLRIAKVDECPLIPIFVIRLLILYRFALQLILASIT
jgi:hypothetical protein